MPRQARLDAPGTLQHVIIRGIERRPIFKDLKDREDFVTRMGVLALETETKIYAWALIANHVHILLRTGPMGLPKYMRRLLTGYAVTYNRRHSRHGYLFQNRYRSIVCDEDTYFLELVRYIHLNPLRAKAIRTISELDRYPWCGHFVLLGYMKYLWQDSDYVLSWFSRKRRSALKAYRQYVEQGASQGRRPELVGDGLVNSPGKSAEKFDFDGMQKKPLADRRILGGEDFAKKILKGSEHEVKYQVPLVQMREKVQSIIEEKCRGENIRVEELRMGARRRPIGEVRSEIAWQLVNDLGIPVVETARQLGVSPSAISKILQRKGTK